jgi:hypothetical protein
MGYFVGTVRISYKHWILVDKFLLLSVLKMVEYYSFICSSNIIFTANTTINSW